MDATRQRAKRDRYPEARPPSSVLQMPPRTDSTCSSTEDVRFELASQICRGDADYLLLPLYIRLVL